MKHIIMRMALVGIISLIIVTGCRRYEAPPANSTTLTPDMTLVALSNMLGDRTITIDSEITVGGYVTSSDEESNFHKTIMIDDGTAAAEVMVGIYDAYRLYPPGHYLAVRLAGCGIGRHYGVMQIGMPAEQYSSFPTDYFASRVLLDRHVVLCDNRHTIPPRPMCIGDLTEDMCGLLVRIDGLTPASHLFPDAWKVNQQGAWAGYNFFQDADGQFVVVYTSDYADYAESMIPSGELSLTGIVQYGSVAGDKYFMIKMRYEDDCEPHI